MNIPPEWLEDSIIIKVTMKIGDKFYEDAMTVIDVDDGNTGVYGMVVDQIIKKIKRVSKEDK